MPQLVKGGKYVFGLAEVGKTGRITIPPEAAAEYGFNDGDRVILINGSRRSGGFGVTKTSLLKESPLATLVKAVPGLAEYRLPENTTVETRGHRLGWTTIRPNGCLYLPEETLLEYGISPGDKLAVGRGSGLALAFIARGPIHEEAMKHPELEWF